MKVFLMTKNGAETTAYSAKMRSALSQKGWTLAYEGTATTRSLGEGKTETVYYFPNKPHCEVERYVEDTWQDLTEAYSYRTYEAYEKGDHYDYFVNDPWERSEIVE